MQCTSFFTHFLFCLTIQSINGLVDPNKDNDLGMRSFRANEQLQSSFDRQFFSYVKIPNQRFAKGKVYDIKATSASGRVALGVRNTIDVSISCTISFKAKWRMTHQSTTKYGRLTAKVTGVKIDMKLKKNRQVPVETCNDSYQKIKITFMFDVELSGKSRSFFDDTFQKLITKRIKKKLKGKFCLAGKKFVRANTSTFIPLTLKPFLHP